MGTKQRENKYPQEASQAGRQYVHYSIVPLFDVVNILVGASSSSVSIAFEYVCK